MNGRIKSQVDKRERAMCGAIADVIAPIEKKYKAQLDELRAEVAALRNEFPNVAPRPRCAARSMTCRRGWRNWKRRHGSRLRADTNDEPGCKNPSNSKRSPTRD